MHIQCPHCHNPIELVQPEARGDVVCPSCGSTFRLDADATVSWGSDVGHRRIGKYELIKAFTEATH